MYTEQLYIFVCIYASNIIKFKYFYYFISFSSCSFMLSFACVTSNVKCQKREWDFLSISLSLSFHLCRVRNVCDSVADTILLFSFIIHVHESIFKYTVVLRSLYPHILFLSSFFFPSYTPRTKQNGNKHPTEKIFFQGHPFRKVFAY